LRLTAAAEGDILSAQKTSKAEGSEVQDVQYVGKLDENIYCCVNNDISTNEVIITGERIQHIKDRHPGHYEKISPFLQTALHAPDYILKDKNPKTALILKEIKENGWRIQIVLRLHTSTDIDGFKNAIISAWEISESRWNNYLRNKKILYKRE